MSKEEFWYGDLELFKVYQQAYYTKVSYEAWQFGLRNFEAYSKALSNSNRAKETDPVSIYDNWVNPMEKINKPVITKENIEEKFREQQIAQNSWLFG